MNHHTQSLNYYYLAFDFFFCLAVGITALAINWHGIVITNSTLFIGQILILGILASFLTNTLLVVIIDSFNKKKILISFSIFRIICSWLLIKLYTEQYIDIYRFMYFFAVLNGITLSIYFSISRSYIKELNSSEQFIIGMNSFIEVTMQAGMFGSAILAGYIYKYHSIENIFYLSCFLHLLSIIFLSFCTSSITDTKKINVLNELKNSLRMNFYGSFQYLSKQPKIFGFIFFSAIPTLFITLFNLILPKYTNTFLSGDSVLFGLLDMSYALGALLSGGICGSFLLKKYKNEYPILIIMAIGLILVPFLLAIINNKIFALIFCLLLGFVLSSIRIIFNIITMTIVDIKYIGRVTTFAYSISLVLQIISIYFFGWIDENFISTSPFLLVSFISVINLIILIVFIKKGQLMKNTNKTMLVLEPNYYGINYIIQAKKMGFKTIAIVSNSNNPTDHGYQDFCDDTIVCDIRNKEEILSKIESSQYADYDFLLAGNEYVLSNASFVNESLNKPNLMSYNTSVLARNKELCRAAMVSMGIESPKFAVVKTLEEAVEQANTIGFPLVLKPTNAACSQNVYYIENQQILEERFKEIEQVKTSYMGFAIKPEFLLEQYISGQEYSVEILLKNAEIIFAVVTKKITTSPPYFAELFHVTPAPISFQEKDLLIHTAKKGLEAINFTNGASHVEVKLEKDKAYIIEINGRPGGDNISSDLMINAFGYNVFEQDILLITQQLQNIKTTKNQASSIQYLTVNKAGIIKSIEGLELIKTHPNVTKSVINLSVGIFVDIPTSSDNRYGYFIVTADTPEKCELISKEIMAQIMVEVG